MDHKDHGTEDKLKGLGNKIKGSVKDVVGDVTNNAKMQVEGKLDKAKGEIQQKIGKAKEHFSDTEARDNRP
ncbi:CsbD family protein [Sporosarcina sp. GW1-11]|uniref:CsbD family protein n=1 Tax=Sporosarcina sp. GW1-11 TaxID=2899126 RepID=UPI00294C9401|nr:CsbD family protein [Sporosarcina sp. GW1-11]MDV6379404.1 CsbD family protein [Sporosarcina sp. GW1-11]